MKGKRKRRNYGLKKGHGLSFKRAKSEDNIPTVEKTKPYVRLDAKKYETVITSQSHGQSEEKSAHMGASANSVGFLRPKPFPLFGADMGTAADAEYGPEAQSYRIIHKRKNEEFWNFVFREHRQKFPKCTGFLYWDEEKEVQWGIGWREAAKCDSCKYRSELHKLYDEIPSFTRGQKMATCNVGLQIGLTQTPISTTSIRKIFMCANIPPPSNTGLQNCSNFVNKLITKANKDDMNKIVNELMSINRLRGYQENVIDTEMDCMYNNPLYSGAGNTPMQPATQVTCIQAENLTPCKYIISLITKNKLCSYHSYHEENTNHVQTQGECSANISITKSIGAEHDWAYESLTELQNKGLEVKNLTTDGDSAAYKAAMKLHRDGKLKTKPSHSIDTVHFARNHRKNMNKSCSVSKMMPARTKTGRDKLRSKFSNDLSKRCQAEYQAGLKSCASDKFAFFRAISHVVDAINLCYLGDHRLCRLNSYVCSKGNSNWIEKSEYLDNEFKIDKTPEFANELRKWIEFRLGRKALETTKFGTTTQKVEATNRSLRRSLPRNVTFSRNFQGRAHSAVHSVNHGPGQSLYLLLQAAKCPVVQGSKVQSGLQQDQKYNIIRKNSKKSDKYKQWRRSKRRKMYQLYENQAKNQLYQKKISMPRLDISVPQDKSLRRKLNPKSDHLYNKTD